MVNLIEFSNQWIQYMKMPDANAQDILSDNFESDCISLGFNLDTGALFAKKYGRASYNVDALIEIMDYLDDSILLGSAIYSRWYHFKYWASKPYEIIEPHNCLWFKSAFERLSYLLQKDEAIIKESIKAIDLVTDIRSSGATYKINDLLKQRLKIDINSSATLTNYYYQGEDAFTEETQSFNISSKDTSEILRSVGSFFEQGFMGGNTEGNGFWNLDIVEVSGQLHNFKGSIYDSVSLDQETKANLSVYIPSETIFGFSAIVEDTITKVTYEYHDNDDVIEKVMFDRKTRSIVTYIESGDSIYNATLEIDDVDYIMDGLEVFFTEIKGYPKDSVSVYEDSEFYSINIEYENSPNRFISGSYDRYSLPVEWAMFLRHIHDTHYLVLESNTFDERLFNRPKRLKDDYMYVRVAFENNSKLYSYISLDDSIRDGMLVVVPVGDGIGVKVGEVVDIAYYNAVDVPYPLDKTKRIIGRYDPKNYKPNE